MSRGEVSESARRCRPRRRAPHRKGLVAVRPEARSRSFPVIPERRGALLPRVLHTRLVARERRGQRPIPVFLKAG